jgi:hypothetical protein
MRILRSTALSSSALGVSLSLAQTDSCPDDIDRMQARIDARVILGR